MNQIFRQLLPQDKGTEEDIQLKRYLALKIIDALNYALGVDLEDVVIHTAKETDVNNIRTQLERQHAFEDEGVLALWEGICALHGCKGKVRDQVGNPLPVTQYLAVRAGEPSKWYYASFEEVRDYLTNEWVEK